MEAPKGGRRPSGVAESARILRWHRNLCCYAFPSSMLWFNCVCFECPPPNRDIHCHPGAGVSRTFPDKALFSTKPKCTFHTPRLPSHMLLSPQVFKKKTSLASIFWRFCELNEKIFCCASILNCTIKKHLARRDHPAKEYP